MPAQQVIVKKKKLMGTFSPDYFFEGKKISISQEPVILGGRRASVLSHPRGYSHQTGSDPLPVNRRLSHRRTRSRSCCWAHSALRSPQGGKCGSPHRKTKWPACPHSAAEPHTALNNRQLISQSLRKPIPLSCLCDFLGGSRRNWTRLLFNRKEHRVRKHLGRVHII